MKVFFQLYFIFCFSAIVTSQNTFDFKYTQPSEAFNKERTFYVHVPERYYETEDRFGVVYVLDAQAESFYNNAKSIIDYLVWSYQIRPVIVVGIHSDDRGPEFIPPSKNNPDNGGTANVLQNHIKNEVFPFIDEQFRVNSFRALIGHSRGGAFIAHTLFGEEKDMFNAYLGISPSMGYLQGEIIDNVTASLKENPVLNKFYFASYGTVGSIEINNKERVDYLDSLLTVHPNSTFHWIKKEIPETTHWGLVAPSVAMGMVEMNRAYQIDQFLIEQFASNTSKTMTEQINAYSESQEKRLGLFFPLQASELRYYGSQFSDQDQYEPALELLEISMDKNPYDIRTYFDKAWALRQLNRPNEAINAYKAGEKMLERQGHTYDQATVDKWKGRLQKELERMNE